MNQADTQEAAAVTCSELELQRCLVVLPVCPDWLIVQVVWNVCGYLTLPASNDVPFVVGLDAYPILSKTLLPVSVNGNWSVCGAIWQPCGDCRHRNDCNKMINTYRTTCAVILTSNSPWHVNSFLSLYIMTDDKFHHWRLPSLPWNSGPSPSRLNLFLYHRDNSQQCHHVIMHQHGTCCRYRWRTVL